VKVVKGEEKGKKSTGKGKGKDDEGDHEEHEDDEEGEKRDEGGKEKDRRKQGGKAKPGTGHPVNVDAHDNDAGPGAVQILAPTDFGSYNDISMLSLPADSARYY